MLEIDLPQSIELWLLEYSRRKNIEVDKVIAHAVKCYLREEEKFLKEIEYWDQLSDEAWSNFEKEYL